MTKMQDQPKTDDYSEKNIQFLKEEMRKMKDAIRLLQSNRLSTELQLPEEIVKNCEGFEFIDKRIRRGRYSAPLLESEIRNAQLKTITAADAARYLRVHYTTYKKYCKLYGIWKTNVHYKKEGRVMDPNKGMYPLTKILNGEFPDYPIYRLKDKLILSGIKKPECEQCGWKERRITDGKLPLLLNFEDGNRKNHKLENMRLLCYNCTFCSGTGYIRKGKKYNILDDPDRMQGANKYINNRF